MRRPRLSTILLAGAALSQAGATKCGQVLRDPGFDLWCGESLCAWKVTRGEVKRVATWHEGDAGVELVGPDVAIQQLTPVNSSDGACIRFELVANVENSAEVYLNVDVQGDGTIERAERIPTAHWKPLSYAIFVQAPYDGIRFELTKRGAGRAVLANIGAELAGKECEGLTPLDPGPRLDGATCYTANDCGSGTCLASPAPPDASLFGLACAGCDPAIGCGPGMACGLGAAFSPVHAIPLACVPEASRAIGEQCLGDGECASGTCMRPGPGAIGWCSSCFSPSHCEAGQQCRQPWTQDVFGQPVGYGPYTCSGGASGAPCAADADCASGSCAGPPRRQCERDGRPCASPADCPFDGLEATACVTVGVQGGACR